MLLVLLIIINIYLIIKYHVPNWMSLSCILLAIDDYRIAGSDTYHSIISYQRHNLIIGFIYTIITQSLLFHVYSLQGFLILLERCMVMS